MALRRDEVPKKPELPPRRLWKFDPQQWPPGDIHERVARWLAARRSYYYAHGRRWPFGPFGENSGLTFSRVNRDMRRWGGVGTPPDESHVHLRLAEDPTRIAAWAEDAPE